MLRVMNDTHGHRLFTGRPSPARPASLTAALLCTRTRALDATTLLALATGSSMGGTQSTPKITAQDRAILEYASCTLLLHSLP